MSFLTVRVQESGGEGETALLDKQIAKLRQGIARLIDSYTEGYLDKSEFEPRIRRFKERLEVLELQAEQLREQSHQQAELQLIIRRLEDFSAKVSKGLGQLDWLGRRELIRTLVKRVEIEQERVNVVFRIEDCMGLSENNHFMQHCRGRVFAVTGKRVFAPTGSSLVATLWWTRSAKQRSVVGKRSKGTARS